MGSVFCFVHRLIVCAYAQTEYMVKMGAKTGVKTLKYLVVISSLGGVLFSLITAEYDGYSRWWRRLMYFTAQSNIWIGCTALLLLLFSDRMGATTQRRIYVLKYSFTVSITLTGLVFCGLLAPFADEGYVPWTIPNLLTHVFTPVFAAADFFLDGAQPWITKKQRLICLLPPLAYCFFASAACGLNIDFGRGENYPYFFLNYRSPSGVFGFSAQRPFFMGEFYWLAILSILVWGIAALYAQISNRLRRKK